MLPAIASRPKLMCSWCNCYTATSPAVPPRPKLMAAPDIAAMYCSIACCSSQAFKHSGLPLDGVSDCIKAECGIPGGANPTDAGKKNKGGLYAKAASPATSGWVGVHMLAVVCPFVDV